MPTEEGIVKRIDNNITFVATVQSSACESCSAKGTCSTLGGGEEREVEVVNNMGAKEGDRVVLFFDTGSMLKATFLLYLFPIICMLIGAFAGQEVSAHINMDESICSVIGGFIFLAGALVYVRIKGGRMGEQDAYRPKIIRIRKT